MRAAEVVVVGGGIAGSSLAYALVREGLDVTVLEATEQYEDRVRGEQMHAWGVKEARDLGVEQILLDAGAHVSRLWKQYIEGAPEPGEVPVSMMVPGVEGTLNMRHPDACQALTTAAARAGARVVRGVKAVRVGANDAVTVAYQHEDREEEIQAGLIVGADGRSSTVRRQAGIGLESDPPMSYIAGLLLDDLQGVPDDFDAMVGEGDVLFVLFHQGNARARAYLMVGKSGQHRFAGANAVENFLAATRLSAFPWSEHVAGATPAGPCATYPGDDTWTPTPFADRVVLIGDAAGYNDPIIGEGLSIAMRDARMVRDLVLDGARTAGAFGPYGEERNERMRRLRLIADVIAVTFAEDADNRSARRMWLGTRLATRDPQVFPLVMAAFAGPETLQNELVDRTILDRIRAA